MSSDFSADAIAAFLDGWEGSPVAVRITFGEPEELAAVFSGRLGRQSEEKAPALFWPVGQADSPQAEHPGIYLHPASFEDGRVHSGNFVVEFRQGSVEMNIRKIDADRPENL